jgi:hypothetical protein
MFEVHPDSVAESETEHHLAHPSSAPYQFVIFPSSRSIGILSSSFNGAILIDPESASARSGRHFLFSPSSFLVTPVFGLAHHF